MADKKISQLNAATTPLAGTEVLPIVQSGNTVKVSVDNLTKGKTVNATTFDTDVAAAAVTLSGITLAADGTDTNIDINITPKGTGEVNLTKVDIDAGAIDGTTIGANSAAAATFTTATANSFAVTTTQNIVTGGMWYQTSGGKLVFTPASAGGFKWNNSANNAEIASLSDGGALVIGGNFSVEVASGNPLILNKTAGAGNNPAYRLQADTNYWDITGVFSNPNDELYFSYNGNNRGYIDSATGTYNAVSDLRLKKDISDISYGLREVMALRPVEYRMKDSSENAQKRLGFIAQEAKTVIPSSVSEMTCGTYAMDRAEMVAVLVKAVQELKTDLDAAKEKIAALETK